MSRIEKLPLTNSRGEYVSARVYVREMTWSHSPLEEQVLNELTIQWRAAVNRGLRGTGAGVVGDHLIITHPRKGQPPAKTRKEIEQVVYSTRLSPAVIYAATIMHMPPSLTVIRDIGVR